VSGPLVPATVHMWAAENQSSRRCDLPAVAGTAVLALFNREFSKSEKGTRNACSKMELYCTLSTRRSAPATHPSIIVLRVILFST
jgi:hypothetical protein